MTLNEWKKHNGTKALDTLASITKLNKVSLYRIISGKRKASAYTGKVIEESTRFMEEEGLSIGVVEAWQHCNNGVMIFSGRNENKKG